MQNVSFKNLFDSISNAVVVAVIVVVVFVHLSIFINLSSQFIITIVILLSGNYNLSKHAGHYEAIHMFKISQIAQYDDVDCGFPHVSAINRKYNLKPLNENKQQLTNTLCLYVCALF